MLINMITAIEQVRKCFCLGGGREVKIYVKDDVIVEAIDPANKSEIPKDEWNWYRTINGLFDEISSTDTSRFLLEVQYDSRYKYPSLVSIRPKPVVVNDSIIEVIADGDISYSTYNYKKYK